MSDETQCSMGPSGRQSYSSTWNSSSRDLRDLSPDIRKVPFRLVPKSREDIASQAIAILLVAASLAASAGFFRRKQNKWQRRISSEEFNVSAEFREAMARKTEFLARYSTSYGYHGTPGGYIDDWRPVELPGLIVPLEANTVPSNIEQEIYLDYAGSSLPTKSQLAAIYQETSSQIILANPHSTGPAASRSLMGIEEAKKRVLEHLDGTPGRFASLRHPPPFAAPTQYHTGYDLAFTSGTTESVRLIAERFPWKAPCQYCRRQSVFLYAQNSHTSILGMRNLATQQGARSVWRPGKEIASMSSQDFDSVFLSPAITCFHCKAEDYPNLVAIPAECNFGGNRLDAHKIIAQARAADSSWFSLVDIAKAASTGRVSLKVMDTDFCALSFYKLFGEPTGLGALIVKQSATQLLQGSGHFQGGGSVKIMLPAQAICIPRSEGLTGLVHGTVHFRGIKALVHGYDELDRRGGMHRIHDHATSLARELTRRLETLRHSNDRRAVMLSGAWADPTLRDTAGPTVVFNVLRDDGSFVGHNEVSKLAALHHPPMQLRTGCFCNPGACQEALQQTDQQALENFETAGHVCGDHIDLVDGRPTGAIRISFGKDSMWEDMDTFITFLHNTFVNDTTSTFELRTAVEPTKVEIAELFLFPIKSCAGQQVRQWRIELPSGKLMHDREFALVDTSGTAIRLQSCPKMTTIQPIIDLQSGMMTVSAPGMNDLSIQFEGGSQHYHDSDNAIEVCGNKCGGRLWGDHAVSEWFSSYLGIQCWLARFDRDGSYKIPTAQGNSELNDPPRAGFANEQALLLISENAVSLLNGVLEEQKQRFVGPRHFRPNLVVRGAGCNGHHIEDEWEVLTLDRNGMKFQTKGSCARCAMVDFDPYNGKKGKTLRALARYRRRKGQITFGVFLQAVQTSLQKDAWIREGDEVVCS